jgi:MinD superfamily P-loop ATPase
MTEVTILSGKGGTGKTSLSAAFATINKDMVIADCDVDAANLYLILQPVNYYQENFITGYKASIDSNTCTNCGLCVAYCRFNAITVQHEQVCITNTLCDGCKLCARICPSQSITMIPNNKSCWFLGNYRNGTMVHARLAPGEENSGKLVNIVRKQARMLANEKDCEIIIIDGPPGTGCPVISSVTGVQKVIVVTEPSHSAFHDMKRVLQLAFNFNIKPYVVINKYDINNQITNQITEWCNQQTIEIAGKIPFCEEIVEAMIHCQSILEYQPHSEVSNAIRSIYKHVFSNA